MGFFFFFLTPEEFSLSIDRGLIPLSEVGFRAGAAWHCFSFNKLGASAWGIRKSRLLSLQSGPYFKGFTRDTGFLEREPSFQMG